MNKILLIGCGHMGSALLSAWSLDRDCSFVVIDPIKYKKINAINNNKILAFKTIKEIKEINKFDIIIFAVKPQLASLVLEEISEYTFNKQTIFVSIVAGKKIDFFNKHLGMPNKFVRVMPNMPVLVNQGMSCLIANKNISKKNKNLIDNLFLKIGKTLWLKNEKDINKVTAISGSGPGYIFLFIDAFEKASAQLGLGNKVTKELIYQTLLGSIDLLLKEKSTASILADNIAVKGGTTEAGLNKFKNKKILHKIFKDAIKAAYDKANFLGKL